MREWINFKVQQFNNDTYLNDELSTIEQQTLKYKISSLHPYFYKGESAKNLEKYIRELLKREYAKNLATQIENNKFIYGNNMADVMSFAKRFIQTYSDVYELNSKADAKNAGTSIKELVKCYKELNNNLFDKKDLDDLTDFLLRLPTEIRIQSQYLDQYAPYYANALNFFLSILTTVFNTDLKQPKPQALSGFSEEIINTDKKDLMIGLIGLKANILMRILWYKRILMTVPPIFMFRQKVLIILKFILRTLNFMPRIHFKR